MGLTKQQIVNRNRLKALEKGRRVLAAKRRKAKAERTEQARLAAKAPRVSSAGGFKPTEPLSFKGAATRRNDKDIHSVLARRLTEKMPVTEAARLLGFAMKRENVQVVQVAFEANRVRIEIVE